MMLGFSGTLVAVAGAGGIDGYILMMLVFSWTLVVFAVAFALWAIYGAIRALTSLKRRAALIATSVISATIVLIYFLVLALLQPISFFVPLSPTIEAGKRLSFGLLVHQNSWAGDVHFSLAPGAPSGARIDEKRKIFSWTPPLDQPAGKYDVTVSASAAGQRASQATFVITVTRPTLPGDK
jgi:hypothetical protein